MVLSFMPCEKSNGHFFQEKFEIPKWFTLKKNIPTWYLVSSLECCNLVAAWGAYLTGLGDLTVQSKKSQENELRWVHT